MKQKVTLNGIEIEIEITKEMARKVLEESEEIEIGDLCWQMDVDGVIEQEFYKNNTVENYSKETDNLLPKKSYTYDQAKEYFDKRDARRAAEYRIKKAIEEMNGDKDRDCEMFYEVITMSLYYSNVTSSVFYSPKYMHFNRYLFDYMLEHHTEDYKIYFGIE